MIITTTQTKQHVYEDSVRFVGYVKREQSILGSILLPCLVRKDRSLNDSSIDFDKVDIIMKTNTSASFVLLLLCISLKKSDPYHIAA